MQYQFLLNPAVSGFLTASVRAWGAAGKSPEYRHPANRYRMYKPADLEKVNQQDELSRK